MLTHSQATDLRTGSAPAGGTSRQALPLSAECTEGEPVCGGSPPSAGHLEPERRLDAVLIVVIALINIACFHRTLDGYFLADDFVHVAYLADVFSGRPELLLSNFWSNWMQAQGTQFYRPLISLSLAVDYWLGSGNPAVFHVSNMLYQIGCCVFLFLTTRRLASSCGWLPSTGLAFIASSLFAVYPLHAEVVSWIIARVDSLCAMFYLASMWLFLRARQDGCVRDRIWSAFAFLLSLLCKEMAVTLPFVLILWCLLDSSGPPRKRLSDAFREIACLLAVLGVYFAVRWLALGTLVGGYGGSIADGLNASLYQRLFADGSFARLFFPLSAESFTGGGSNTRTILALIYTLGTALLLSRLVASPGARRSMRVGLFASGWLVLAMLPTYQVWNLLDNLQGSRFFYMASAPFCLALAWALMPLVSWRAQQPGKKWAMLSLAAGASLSLALIATFGNTAYRNNQPWAGAFQHTRQLREAVCRKLGGMPAERKLVLLNVPHRHQGAHMIYNATMLNILLSPPLSPPGMSERIVTFEPVTYGDPELVPPSRLRQLASHSDVYEFCWWNSTLRQLVPFCPSTGKTQPYHLSISDPVALQTGGNLHIAAYLSATEPFSPLDFDILRLTVTGCDDFIRPDSYVILSWNSVDTSAKPEDSAADPGGRVAGLRLTERQDPSSGTELNALATEAAERSFKRHGAMVAQLVPGKTEYLFHVSERKSWITADSINNLRVDFLIPDMLPEAGGDGPAVAAAGLEPGVMLVPHLIPSCNAAGQTLRADGDGVWRNTGERLIFDFDASALPSAQQVLVEVSTVNSWFEHYSGTYRDSSASPRTGRTLQLASRTGRFNLCASEFPSDGFYQIRLLALDAKGAVTGFASDPVNLQVTRGRPSTKNSAH